MGGCCVPRCSNSRRKGFVLKVLPHDTERRALWIKKINRKNWKPSPSSRPSICEVHFEPDMWEKPRVDGKKQLKFDAVPTLFLPKNKKALKRTKKLDDTIAVKDELDQKEVPCVKLEDDELVNELNTIDHEEKNVEKRDENADIFEEFETHDDFKTLIKLEELNKETAAELEMSLKNDDFDDSEQEVMNIISFDSLDEQREVTENMPENISLGDKTIFPIDDEKKLMHNIIRNQQKLISHYKQKLKSMKRKQNDCNDEKSKDLYKSILESLFNKDQIQHLKIELRKQTSELRWSNETINDAQDLISTCGIKGYNKLLRKSYPFPSIRVLKQRANEQNCDDIFEDKIQNVQWRYCTCTFNST